VTVDCDTIPPEAPRPLTVSVALPLLEIVNVALRLAPTWTSPNTRFPLTPMMRVVTGAADVGAAGVGAVGVLPLPDSPLHALRHPTMAMTSTADFTCSLEISLIDASPFTSQCAKDATSGSA
jgi:hypothetical protein